MRSSKVFFLLHFLHKNLWLAKLQNVILKEGVRRLGGKNKFRLVVYVTSFNETLDSLSEVGEFEFLKRISQDRKKNYNCCQALLPINNPITLASLFENDHRSNEVIGWVVSNNIIPKLLDVLSCPGKWSLKSGNSVVTRRKKVSNFLVD